MRLAWDGSLHIAPIEKPQRILDVGTGTGIWALDIAEQFPMAEVIGTDPSPIQPNCGPANWYGALKCIPSIYAIADGYL